MKFYFIFSFVIFTTFTSTGQANVVLQEEKGKEFDVRSIRFKFSYDKEFSNEDKDKFHQIFKDKFTESGFIIKDSTAQMLIVLNNISVGRNSYKDIYSNRVGKTISGILTIKIDDIYICINEVLTHGKGWTVYDPNSIPNSLISGLSVELLIELLEKGIAKKNLLKYFLTEEMYFHWTFNDNSKDMRTIEPLYWLSTKGEIIIDELINYSNRTWIATNSKYGDQKLASFFATQNALYIIALMKNEKAFPIILDNLSKKDKETIKYLYEASLLSLIVYDAIPIEFKSILERIKKEESINPFGIELVEKIQAKNNW